ncbi:MAG: hypothetical protein J5602_11380 [Clostridia bacterium]|nr:hypothetical protein [Clostridia bacterium]
MELYDDATFQATKRSTLFHFGVMALILAVTIVLLALFVTIWRNELISMAVCAVGASALFFYLSLKALPWVHYWHYQSDIKKGRAHELDCRFVSLSDSERISDGVAFRDFIVTLEDADGEDDQRLLLWDADKKAPQLKPEQRLHIRAFGNYIIALDAR